LLRFPTQTEQSAVNPKEVVMTGFDVLWLPILIASVITFAVSCVIHMFLPYHKNDYRKAPKEDEILNAIRPLGIPPGDYVIPRATDMKEMRSPEYAEKMKKGPLLVLTLKAHGTTSMTKSLVLHFIYMIVVSIFAAYIAGRALPPGSTFLAVLRFSGAAAFMGYALAVWPFSIWYGRSWSTSVKDTIDGLVYGIVTGLVMGWLWPR
jgi:hypothetical protein